MITDAAVHTTGINWESVAVIISSIAIILTPMIAFLYRTTVKWTHVEDKLENVVEDVKDLVKDKDKVHTEILSQMTHDRDATDKRLRWLEQNLWRRKGPNE